MPFLLLVQLYKNFILNIIHHLFLYIIQIKIFKKKEQLPFLGFFFFFFDWPKQNSFFFFSFHSNTHNASLVVIVQCAFCKSTCWKTISTHIVFCYSTSRIFKQSTLHCQTKRGHYGTCHLEFVSSSQSKANTSFKCPKSPNVENDESHSNMHKLLRPSFHGILPLLISNICK